MLSEENLNMMTICTNQYTANGYKLRAIEGLPQIERRNQ